MKLTGIIAEYNPFHTGHAYHIRESKELTGSRFCVVVMSGDFVQRGEPAVYSKYLRARMALSGGADLVVEMPSAFAVSSAEDFAACGVALLSSLGAVDTLCFGSEAGSICDIQAAAGLLAQESPEFSAFLAGGLKQGLSWPQARNRALWEIIRRKEDLFFTKERLDGLLGSPNNVLGIEYCKAILRSRSTLKPVTLKRTGQGYHDLELRGGQASASALRRLLIKQEEGQREEFLGAHVPASILPLYTAEPAVSPEDFSGLLNHLLLTLSYEARELSLYADLSEEMAARLSGCLLEYGSWEDRVRQLKTRQYTYTRVSRALLHLLLGITDRQISEYKRAGYAPYARILGFREESKEVLSYLKKQSSIPLITKTADASRILSGTALAMLNRDIYSTHVRQSVLAHVHGYRAENEFTQPLCIL